MKACQSELFRQKKNSGKKSIYKNNSHKFLTSQYENHEAIKTNTEQTTKKKGRLISRVHGICWPYHATLILAHPNLLQFCVPACSDKNELDAMCKKFRIAFPVLVCLSFLLSRPPPHAKLRTAAFEQLRW